MVENNSNIGDGALHSSLRPSGRYTWLLIAVTTVLFGYVCLRAAVLSLTFDEITSLLFTQSWDGSGVASDANVHLLNVVLVSLVLKLGAPSELLVRAPNTMAFLIYAMAIIDLGRYLRREVALVQFAMLTLCPFVLDFFSLNRGYGLGLGAMLLSLACAARAMSHGSIVWGIASVLAGMAGVLASYPMINFLLPLSAVLFFGLAHSSSSRKAAWGRATGLLVPLVCFLYLLVPVLMELRAGGHLYFGGRRGFWIDTVGSLGRCIGYHQAYSSFVELAFLLFFTFAIVSALWMVTVTLRKRRSSLTFLLGAVMLGGSLAPVVQHWLLDTNFPVERTAIMYYPLSCLVCLHALNAWRGPLVKGALFALVILSLTHFMATMNMTKTYSWRYDSASRDAIVSLMQRFQGPVRLSIDFFNGPSIRYYRSALGAHSIEVTEVMGPWRFRPGPAELQPAFYGHAEALPPLDVRTIKEPVGFGPVVYYLDRYYLEEMTRLGYRYKILQHFPQARTSLITDLSLSR